LYLIFLCATVFSPVDPNSDGIFGFIRITGFAERFLNLFLLMPLAILTRISYRHLSFRFILFLCILTSVGIETIQLSIPGRVSDPIDVLTNCMGAGFSLLVFRRFAQKRSTYRP